jgi:N-acetylneuraminic acid mutarotase
MRILKSLLVGLSLAALLASCGPNGLPALENTPATSILESGVGGGNGGDPRILKFGKAKVESANWAGKLSLYPERLAQSDHQKIRDFVASDEFLQELAADILASPHRFVEGAAGNPLNRCAWTNDSHEASLDTIRFWLDRCDQGLQQEGRLFANLTLIHESMHHMIRKTPEMAFATEDEEEDFCNQAALEIASAHESIVADGIAYWGDVSVDGNPSSRAFHAAAWTGDTGSDATKNRMIVWGGCAESPTSIYGCGQYFKDGGLYDMASDSWTKMADAGAPEARAHHTGVFTGRTGNAASANRYVVWGGCTADDACVNYLGSGGIFDVNANSWTAVASHGAPQARASHSAVLAGGSVIVWGGEIGANTPNVDSTPLATGAKLDVATNTWSAIATPSAAVLLPRRDHTAIFTGANANPAVANKMIVFGGCDTEVVWYCHAYYNTGAIYDVATDTWTPLPTEGAPDPRRFHSAIWTGRYMIVWGGEGKTGNLKTGGVYDPAANKWYRTKSLGPDARARHTAVWTGDRMIVFGGELANDTFAKETYVYTPAVAYTAANTGSWEKVPVEFDPIQVKGHSAVWTGDAMMIWGGQNRPNSFANTGAVFHPGQDL